MYLVKSPRLLKWFYPSLVWNKSRKEKIVYLTFDDGPIPNVTDFVLNTLKTYSAQATFFCIGDNIRKHPELFEQVKQAGHSIGNHTYNHLKGWDTDDQTYLHNVAECQKLTKTSLFRPPYGRIKKSQIQKLHKQGALNHTLEHRFPKVSGKLEIIMWDLLSGDFDPQLSPEKCYQNVINNVENGAIIVFHDSLKAFDRLSYALPKTLDYLSAKGYQFGKL